MEGARPPIYPELLRLQETVPPTGFGFHGTSRSRWEKSIKTEGLKTRTKFGPRIQPIHYFYVMPDGVVKNQSYAYKAFSDALSMSFANAISKSISDNSEPILILLFSNNPLNDARFNEPVEFHSEEGLPIHCTTMDESSLRAIGGVDFAIDYECGSFQPEPTIQNITNFFSNEIPRL